MQANAQQLYVINGDGGIGVAYTYRNFTATSQYYGVALTGNYTTSEAYEVGSPQNSESCWSCMSHLTKGADCAASRASAMPRHWGQQGV